MSALDQQANEIRQRLIERDEALLADLVVFYSGTVDEMDLMFDQLDGAIVAERNRGNEPSMRWLLAALPFLSLLFHLQRRMDMFAMLAQVQINRAVQDSLEHGLEDGARLVQAATRQPIKLLPAIAVAALLSKTTKKAGIPELFQSFGLKARRHALNVLVEAFKRGWKRDLAADWFKAALQSNLTQVRAIGRTESMNAFRDGERAAFEENEVVRWMWRCQLSRSTCLACLAMDGQIFPQAVSLRLHVNCRCYWLPVVEHGIGPKRETGAEWFARQDEDTQRQMMGTNAFEYFKAGEIDLQSFLGRVAGTDRRVSVYQRSLKEILGYDWRRATA